MPRLSRNYVIAGSVLLFHAAALWALQTGLVRRAVELVVPVEMLTELISPPAPQVQAPPAPEPPAPVKQPAPRKIQRATAPAPRPVAIAETAPAPAPDAPTGVVSPQPPAPPMAAAAPPAPPAPPKIELPSSSADYLQNPKLVYPPLSKRLGEQGKVMVRVLIAADGTVQSATLAQSSGFTRLDESAMAAVLKWRFVPGKRNGVAEAMWHQIPVNFVLE